jgi:serine/threonine protein kinase
MREAQLGAQISHPGICRILDAGRSDNDFFFVMEYLEGRDLSRVIREDGPLEVQRGCEYAIQIVEVLRALADRNIVHRDVKPNNIMVCPDGRLKLLDLGLAKDLKQEGGSFETRSGAMMGTPAYMAPEQIQNAARVTPAADLYGIGCTLFQMFTGRAPFVAREVYRLLELRLYGETPDPGSIRPDLPRVLAALIRGLMSRNPMARPSHADVLEVLAEIVALDPRSFGPHPPRIVLGAERPGAFDELPTQADMGEAWSGVAETPVQAPATVISSASDPWVGPVGIGRARTVWIRCREIALREAVHLARIVQVARAALVRWFWPLARHPEIRSPGVAVEPPSPPPAVVPIRPTTEILASIAEAKGVLHHLDIDDLADWLPVEDGLACVGNYLLVERIGLKSAVNTYRARHHLTGAEAVVRVLPVAFGQLAPDKLRELLTQRGRLMKLSAASEHLARLVDLGRAPLTRGNFRTIYYTVEDRLDGRSLEHVIETKAVIDPPRLTRYLTHAALGLMALHDCGILHGNLHAGKLLLDEATDRVRLCDFSRSCGARAAADPEGPGNRKVGERAINDIDVFGGNSPKRRRYLAPENLCEDGPLGCASEQYALGLVFIECASGRSVRADANDVRQLKYALEDLEDILRQVSRKSPKIGRILKRMVDINADRRFPDLRSIIDELSTVSGPRPRRGPKSRKGRAPAGLAAAQGQSGTTDPIASSSPAGPSEPATDGTDAAAASSPSAAPAVDPPVQGAPTGPEASPFRSPPRHSSAERPKSRWASLRAGETHEFVCLRVEIAEEGRTNDAPRDVSPAQLVAIDEVTDLIGMEGGRLLGWQGAAGAFLFLTTASEAFDGFVHAAWKVLLAMPRLNERISQRGRPLAARLAIDAGHAVFDPNPGSINGDFIDPFPSDDEDARLPNAVTITDRIYRETTWSVRQRFTELKFSVRLRRRLYVSTVIELQTGPTSLIGPIAAPEVVRSAASIDGIGRSLIARSILSQEERFELVAFLTQLAPTDFSILVAMIDGAAQHVSRNATVSEQVSELIRWAESRPGRGFASIASVVRKFREQLREGRE